MSAKPTASVAAKSLLATTATKTRGWSAGCLVFSLILSVILLSGMGPAQAKPALSADQQQDLKRAEDFLNNIKSIKSRFLQISSNGAAAEGDFILSRPGRMLIAYDPPTPVEIIADGTFVYYHDKELKEVTTLTIDMSPAAPFLADHFKFNSDDYQVSQFEHEKGSLHVGLVKKDDPLAGSLIITFTDSPLALKKWTVIDAQGQITTVSLMGAQRDVAIDPKTFDFTNPYITLPKAD